MYNEKELALLSIIKDLLIQKKDEAQNRKILYSRNFLKNSYNSSLHDKNINFLNGLYEGFDRSIDILDKFIKIIDNERILNSDEKLIKEIIKNG